MAEHKYRVNVDWLEKAIKRNEDGIVKATKMFKRGKVVDYSDEPDRAKELLAHKALVPVDTDEEDAPSVTEAAVNDKTNGGAAGGLAQPGPTLDESVQSGG